MNTETGPVRIFIAYSSKDLAYKEEIRRRLKPLLRANKVSIWDNYDIEAGADWDTDIREKLGQADLILLLLSPDALDSDYFYDVEAPLALQRHQAGDAIAVGVLLRPCGLKHTPFEKLERYELLPKKGYPVTDPHWHNADAAYLTIFEEIDLLVEKVEALRLVQALRLQRHQEYAALVAQADKLAKKKEWAKAKTILDNALENWEEGFVPAREGLEKQRKKCADELLAVQEADKKQREEQEQRQRVEADHAAWKTAEEAANEAGYLKYRHEYPEGIHADAANPALITIEEAKKETDRRKREQEITLAAGRQKEAEQRTREITAQKQRHEAELKKREQEDTKAEKIRQGHKTLGFLAVDHLILQQAARRPDPFADLMAPIKGGSFDIGDTFGEGSAAEKPVHHISIKDFYLCKYPVTQAQWKAIIGRNPSYFKDEENLPVETVSWDDAQNFIKKLNKKTGQHYRLPSEAEWEYAAREGGKKVRFGNGKNIADPAEICFDGSRYDKQPYSIVGEIRKKTIFVNAFAPNALDLYQMSGNIGEWCQDVWHDNYKDAPNHGKAWEQGGDTSLRVVRGGSWCHGPDRCRATFREKYPASNLYMSIGFRLAR